MYIHRHCLPRLLVYLLTHLGLYKYGCHIYQTRRKVLVNGVVIRLKELILEACQEMCVGVIEMEIMPDHVHLLMEVDPQFGIHRAVKAIKGKTSRVLRSEFPSLKSRLPSLWTNGYFVSTVCGAPLSAIKQYIENQKNV